MQADDLRAFDELYHRYMPKLASFLSHVYRNRDLEEEVIQEVFIKIWENRQTINKSLSFEGYIRVIAKNLVYDKFKERQKLVFSNIHHLKTHPAQSNGIEEKIFYQELNTQIENIIAQLPDAQKQIFTMSRKEGLNNAEIAQKLSISKRTVEHQIYRTLKKIKDHLEFGIGIVILILFERFL